VAQSSREWIASTNEAAMAGLAGRLREGPACAADVDVAVRVSWARFGEGADVVAAWLGENDLLPRLGEADVRGSLATRIKALSHLGELRIDGEARTNVIKFTGSLAESTGEEAE
ncbi:MAG: hypothetical protein SGI88_04540, partial [Candidatus Hydrogenedentes bacterium]|nr:hypothetical protein [Candidatus Hydrogenedentota bacterium]